jgi:hypothetical protein
VAHLRAVLTAAREHRAFVDIAWSLWWQGLEVAEADIRGQLRELAVELDTQRAALCLDSRGDALLDAAESLSSSERLPKAFRAARRKLGREDFLTLIYTAGEIVSGTFDGFPLDELTGEPLVAELVLGALGALDQSSPTCPASDLDGLTEHLRTIGKLASTSAVEALAQASWVRLCEMPSLVDDVRAEVRIIESPRAVATSAVSEILGSSRPANQRLTVMMCLQLGLMRVT